MLTIRGTNMLISISTLVSILIVRVHCTAPLDEENEAASHDLFPIRTIIEFNESHLKNVYPIVEREAHKSNNDPSAWFSVSIHKPNSNNDVAPHSLLQFFPIHGGVLEIGYDIEIDDNPRHSMEDRILIETFQWNGDRDVDHGDQLWLIAAVFDGHGGSQVTDLLKDSMTSFIEICTEELAALRDETNEDAESAILLLKCAFRHAAWYAALDELSSGSTATVSLIDQQGRIFIGVLGDSRAMLVSPSHNTYSTADHQPGLMYERQRTLKAMEHYRNSAKTNEYWCQWSPSRIINFKAQSRDETRSLGMSRSFGDYRVKSVCPGVVIEIPDLYQHTLPWEDEAVLVIASDGVWNAFNRDSKSNLANSFMQTNRNVANKIRASERKSVVELAEQLVEKGKNVDDASAIVIRFKAT